MANPRTTRESKILRGTYRKDRDKPATARERLTEPPEPPDALSHGARDEWQALAPVLVELGTLCRGDLWAFEQLTETLATQNSLQAVIEAEGVLIRTGTGSFKTNPAMRSLETARAQAMRLYCEFGLTPKSRKYAEQAPSGESADYPGFQTIPR